MARYVRVGAFPSRPMAELAVSYLNANGVDAMVWADDAGGTYPHMALLRGISLRVHEDDAEVAQRLLDEAEATVTEPDVDPVRGALELRPVAKRIIRVAAAAVVAGIAITELVRR